MDIHIERDMYFCKHPIPCVIWNSEIMDIWTTQNSCKSCPRMEWKLYSLDFQPWRPLDAGPLQIWEFGEPLWGRYFVSKYDQQNYISIIIELIYLRLSSISHPLLYRNSGMWPEFKDSVEWLVKFVKFDHVKQQKFAWILNFLRSKDHFRKHNYSVKPGKYTSRVSRYEL